jgi:hypothetical protein
MKRITLLLTVALFFIFATSGFTQMLGLSDRNSPGQNTFQAGFTKSNMMLLSQTGLKNYDIFFNYLQSTDGGDSKIFGGGVGVQLLKGSFLHATTYQTINYNIKPETSFEYTPLLVLGRELVNKDYLHLTLFVGLVSTYYFEGSKYKFNGYPIGLMYQNKFFDKATFDIRAEYDPKQKVFAFSLAINPQLGKKTE